MNSRIVFTITLFLAITGFSVTILTYSLLNYTPLNPGLIIQVCTQLLGSLNDQVNFNLFQGIHTSTLIISVTGFSLATFRLIQFITSNRQLSKTTSPQSLPNKLKTICKNHHLSQSIFVIKKDKTAQAYTAGITNPKIILTSPLITRTNTKQLEAIVLHEYYHLKNHHLSWLLIIRLIRSALFFLPIISQLSSKLVLELELSADNYVVSQQKTNHHLKSALALNLAVPRQSVLNFAATPLESRVDYLISNKVTSEKSSFTQTLISIIIIGGISAIVFTQPTPTTALNSTDGCNTQEQCQPPGCTGHNSVLRLYTPTTPATFPNE